MTLFEFLMMIASVAIAVGMTEIVGGWGHLLRTRGIVKADWLHLGWTIFILFWLLSYWMGMWAYNVLPIEYFGQVLFLVIPTLFGVLAAYAITPNVPNDGKIDVREYYIAKRTAIFLPLVGFGLMLNVADFVIAGVDKVIVGPETLLSFVHFGLLLSLIFTKRVWFHSLVLAFSTLILIRYLPVHTTDIGMRWVT